MIGKYWFWLTKEEKYINLLLRELDVKKEYTLKEIYDIFSTFKILDIDNYSEKHIYELLNDLLLQLDKRKLLKISYKNNILFESFVQKNNNLLEPLIQALDRLEQENSVELDDKKPNSTRLDSLDKLNDIANYKTNYNSCYKTETYMIYNSGKIKTIFTIETLGFFTIFNTIIGFVSLFT